MNSLFADKPEVKIAQDIKDALEYNADPYPMPANKRFQYGTAGVSGSTSI